MDNESIQMKRKGAANSIYRIERRDAVSNYAKREVRSENATNANA